MLTQGQQREDDRASRAQQISEQSMTRLEMSTQGQHEEMVIEPRNLNRERDSDTLMRTTELRAVDDIAELSATEREGDLASQPPLQRTRLGHLHAHDRAPSSQ